MSVDADLARGHQPGHSPGLLAIHAQVREALDLERPVVALESTIVTHGLPRPRNLEAARRSEAAIRDGGAVPATIALHDGVIRIGLAEGELDALAAEPEPTKVSRQDLAAALGRSGWAGTTVSATMIAAQAAGIRVFATGGIGGVHRGGERSLDISADLEELARTPVVVVCAGPKSILDVGRTLEYLETRGVPVLGYATDEVPGFFSRSSGHRAPARVETPDEVAGIARRHWQLGLASGLMVCVPPPEDEALARHEADSAIERAIADAEAAGIHGPASTPWVLARVARLTDGRSVTANLALIERNAHVAAVIAVALAGRRDG